MFDYILTGPISAVTAGQYLIGLWLEILGYATGSHIDKATQNAMTQWGSVFFASAITLYFFRKNIIGIHESSEKALMIMIATTVMAVVMFSWCGVTLWVEGPKSSVLREVDLRPKIDHSAEDPATAPIIDPTGFLSETSLAEKLRGLHGKDWLSLFGLLGLFIAFGHSILAMSGEETLAQVYREVESPKLPNFKKAAFIVFVYSLVLTAGISFMAVLLIPHEIRKRHYSANPIRRPAPHVLLPPLVK